MLNFKYNCHCCKMVPPSVKQSKRYFLTSVSFLSEGERGESEMKKYIFKYNTIGAQYYLFDNYCSYFCFLKCLYIVALAHGPRLKWSQEFCTEEQQCMEL